MKPRRDDGDDEAARRVAPPAVHAAMKPRRDDGDDDAPVADQSFGDGAAMKPRRDDGDDPRGLLLMLRGGWAAMKPRRDDGDDGSLNSSRLTSNVTVLRETCAQSRTFAPLFTCQGSRLHCSRGSRGLKRAGRDTRPLVQTIVGPP